MFIDNKIVTGKSLTGKYVIPQNDPWLYRNQIEDNHYKKMFMLDSKLAFNISKRIEFSASITNLLNRKEYSYTSYGTISQYERSSKLRGREFLISLYLKK